MTRNFAFSCGVLPGSSRFLPSSVPSDQLLCLPEPLTPANGFSCSRQTKPCRSAIFSQGLHGQLVVVDGQVERLEDRGDLELRRGHFVVLGLGRNAQLPELAVQFVMKASDAVA